MNDPPQWLLDTARSGLSLALQHRCLLSSDQTAAVCLCMRTAQGGGHEGSFQGFRGTGLHLILTIAAHAVFNSMLCQQHAGWRGTKALPPFLSREWSSESRRRLIWHVGERVHCGGHAECGSVEIIVPLRVFQWPFFSHAQNCRWKSKMRGTNKISLSATARVGVVKLLKMKGFILPSFVSWLPIISGRGLLPLSPASLILTSILVKSIGWALRSHV